VKQFAWHDLTMCRRACWLLLLLSTSVFAQTPRSLFDEGTALYSQGQFAEAARKFEASFTARPVPVTKFNVARAWEQAGETLKAIDAWQAWLDMSPTSPERTTAEQSLQALGAKLSKLGVQALTLTSLPVGARVSIDGSAMGVTPLTVELTPTRHLIRLEAEGRVPLERTYVLRLERPAVETFDLAPLEGGPVATPLPLSPMAPAPVTPSRGEDTVEVHVAAPGKEVRLFRLNGNPNGECRAPCDVPITRASDAFYLAGRDLISSGSFILLDHAKNGRVSIQIKTKGSPTWLSLGGLLFGLSAVVGGASTFTAAIYRGSQPWNEGQTIFFGTSLGFTLLGAIGIAIVAATNGTTVTFDGE
jgi:PEGA domain